ncbi:unnamed protein product [Soboliphyme baturini]|uniref:Suppressor protein SRP40-like n=1 Tax=Soboliphyme baturini TaxID=241478 RepID=A0A183J7G0_9BILA|nr:unnamed protein product [Soboliphyme baturini]
MSTCSFSRYSPKEVDKMVDEYRTLLTKQMEHKMEPTSTELDEFGRLVAHETHQVAELQIERNKHLRMAFGISDDYVDGSAIKNCKPNANNKPSEDKQHDEQTTELNKSAAAISMNKPEAGVPKSTNETVSSSSSSDSDSDSLETSSYSKDSSDSDDSSSSESMSESESQSESESSSSSSDDSDRKSVRSSHSHRKTYSDIPCAGETMTKRRKECVEGVIIGYRLLDAGSIGRRTATVSGEVDPGVIIAGILHATLPTCPNIVGDTEVRRVLITDGETSTAKAAKTRSIGAVTRGSVIGAAAPAKSQFPVIRSCRPVLTIIPHLTLTIQATVLPAQHRTIPQSHLEAGGNTVVPHHRSWKDEESPGNN